MDSGLRQRLRRLGATDHETLGLGRALHRPSEDQGLDLIVELPPRPPARAREARRDLAENDDNRVGTGMSMDRIEHRIDRREVAGAGRVSRHIGRDINEVAISQLAGIRGEPDAGAARPDEIVEVRLDNRQLPAREPRDQIAVRRKAKGRESLARGRGRRAQAEMGHPHIGDLGTGHALAAALVACSERRDSVRNSQISFPRSAGLPSLHRRLK